MGSKASEIEKGMKISNEETIITSVPAFGMRHVQMLLLFFLCFVTYCMKSFLSTAVVAMTETPSASPNPDIPYDVFENGRRSQLIETSCYKTIQRQWKFERTLISVYGDWDNSSVILSSFLWGYIVFQVYAGQVAKTHGPKWFLFSAIGVCGTICAFMPLSAKYFGSTGMIVCRVGQGLALGFVFPSIHGIMGNWIPKDERSTLGSFAYSGGNIGTIFGTLSAGYLSASWVGWPSVFYLMAGISYLWCLLWFFFGCNSPEVHSSITNVEKKYIMASLGQQEGAGVIATPWKEILTSMPFLAILVSNIGVVWVSNTFIMETPTYMVKVLGLEVDTASSLTIVYSALSPVVSFLSAILGDRIIRRKILRVVTIRKSFHIVATLLPAALYTILGFLPKDQTALCVTVMTTALVIGGLTVNSTTVNYMDLSPKFSSVMMGISNGIAQAISIFAPLMVQFAVPDETDVSQWRIVFLTTAGIVLASSVFYVAFVSGDRQSWDEGTTPKENKDENK